MIRPGERKGWARSRIIIKEKKSRYWRKRQFWISCTDLVHFTCQTQRFIVNYSLFAVYCSKSGYPINKQTLLKENIDKKARTLVVGILVTFE